VSGFESVFLSTGQDHYIVAGLIPGLEIGPQGEIQQGLVPNVWEYVVTVTNPGPCDASQVTITDTLPQEFLPDRLLARLHTISAPPSANVQLGGVNVSLPLTSQRGDEPSDVSATIPGLPAHASVELVIPGQFFPRHELRTSKHPGAPLRQVNQAIVDVGATAFSTNQTTVRVLLGPKIENVKVESSGWSGDAIAGEETGKALGFIASPKTIDVAAVEAFLNGGRSVARASAARRCAWVSGHGGRLRRIAANRQGRCVRPVWLRAKGAAHWRYKLIHKLPRGSYRLYVRVTDRAGIRVTFERPFSVR
jgi:hypothetical protein